jgi:hypothetical protein
LSYDDRSVKPMSASLMRARIATKILAGLYEDVPAMLTSENSRDIVLIFLD